jgi:hypothetical protein
VLQALAEQQGVSLLAARRPCHVDFHPLLLSSCLQCTLQHSMRVWTIASLVWLMGMHMPM